MIKLCKIVQTLMSLYILFCSVMYYNYAGGVVTMKRENVIKVNGYSNDYWGWGNEDDDLSARYIGSASKYIPSHMPHLHVYMTIHMLPSMHI